MRLVTGALGCALALSTAVVPAHAESAKQGFLCSATGRTDRSVRPVEEYIDLTGGPLVIVDAADPTVVHSGRLTCALHIGDENATYLGAAVVTATGPEMSGVVAMASLGHRTVRDKHHNRYTCTSVATDEGATWYFTQDATGDEFWSSDPTVPCLLQPGYDDPAMPPLENALLDPVVCPVLATRYPGGDVVWHDRWIWDCYPEYENW
jgi:hypothetical protein